MAQNYPYQGNTASGYNPCLENAYRNLSMPTEMDGEYRAEQTCPAGQVQYFVKAGDTLYAIARLYGTTVAAIMAANPGIGEIIYIGQPLCIPTSTACPGTMYTIVAGDTLYALARRYGTTVDAIIAANPGINPNNLRIGMQICIPTTPGTCPANSMPYQIVSGDTLWALARRFGTTVEAIMALNPGLDPNNLQVARIICIPTMTPPSTCPAGSTAHTVVAGDTL